MTSVSRLVAGARVHDEPRRLVDHDDVVVGVDDRDLDVGICLDSVRLVSGDVHAQLGALDDADLDGPLDLPAELDRATADEVGGVGAAQRR